MLDTKLTLKKPLLLFQFLKHNLCISPDSCSAEWQKSNSEDLRQKWRLSTPQEEEGWIWSHGLRPLDAPSTCVLSLVLIPPSFVLPSFSQANCLHRRWSLTLGSLRLKGFDLYSLFSTKSLVTHHPQLSWENHSGPAWLICSSLWPRCSILKVGRISDVQVDEHRNHLSLLRPDSKYVKHRKPLLSKIY